LVTISERLDTLKKVYDNIKDIAPLQGKVTDLWIRLDGKEYHFELKHEEEKEK
jgi:hypothetical protein